ncbi:DarT ssDNA thymidine ADP-ribosyltransferase family protein [Emticicia sp. 21SJ11W-3]|uniref:DarT ssDNA thymidine ADP-ribosyltransferase family protein n=1 Tax=Emticicia sp. 21SJ11W-3 TaxID=2916755 RepID=UPI0020A10BA1|nr:DarT ssDNA thymidine ADP-ribosyltransferase family protein [Emticicia sp. 21SJ11W-3]UTA66858.1 DUF4433 domain-containing protein [Emticicia sp. 21SJ11W-3]
MPLAPKDGKLIYHITAIRNFENILINGLKPRDGLDGFIDVADTEILEHRAKFNLNKFVPFHFFAPTPFAGNIQKTFKTESFIYLAVNREKAIEGNFSIIPTHPLNYNDEPLPYSEGFESIDWELMKVRDYKNHSCKEVCLAECITPNIVPISMIDIIFVKNDNDKKIIEGLVKKSKVKVNFRITPVSQFFIK